MKLVLPKRLEDCIVKEHVLAYVVTCPECHKQFTPLTSRNQALWTISQHIGGKHPERRGEYLDPPDNGFLIQWAPGSAHRLNLSESHFDFVKGLVKKSFENKLSDSPEVPFNKQTLLLLQKFELEDEVETLRTLYTELAQGRL